MIRINIADSTPVRIRVNDETTIRVSIFAIDALSKSLNEHVTEKTNPHPTNVNQEFADAQISGLKSVTGEGEIPDADYNAFKSFFSGLVDKSVKSFIRGLVSWVKSLADRVGLLEDAYILKYVVPVDASMVELTTDKYGRPFNFQEGEEIEISFRIKPFPGEVNSRIDMRVNGIGTANYNWASGSGRTFIATAGSNYYGQSTVLKLKIIVGELNGYMMTMPFTDENTLVSTQAYGISSQGLNLSAINSIRLWSQATTVVPAGFTVLVKKL